MPEHALRAAAQAVVERRGGVERQERHAVDGDAHDAPRVAVQAGHDDQHHEADEGQPGPNQMADRVETFAVIHESRRPMKDAATESARRSRRAPVREDLHPLADPLADPGAERTARHDRHAVTRPMTRLAYQMPLPSMASVSPMASASMLVATDNRMSVDPRWGRPRASGRSARRRRIIRRPTSVSRPKAIAMVDRRNVARDAGGRWTQPTTRQSGTGTSRNGTTAGTSRGPRARAWLALAASDTATASIDSPMATTRISQSDIRSCRATTTPDPTARPRRWSSALCYTRAEGAK